METTGNLNNLLSMLAEVDAALAAKTLFGIQHSLELGTWSLSGVCSLVFGVWSLGRPGSVPVPVRGHIAAALQVGQQVQNLVFREGIQQPDRHRRRTLGLPVFDVG